MGSGVNERVWKSVSGVGRNTGGIVTGWLGHRGGGPEVRVDTVGLLACRVSICRQTAHSESVPATQVVSVADRWLGYFKVLHLPWLLLFHLLNVRTLQNSHPLCTLCDHLLGFCTSLFFSLVPV